MKKRKILPICLAAVTCFALLSGCGKTSADEQSVKKLASVSDFSGETIDFFNGSAIDARLRKIIPDFETRWVEDNSAGIEDVKAGKAAAYMVDLPVAKYAVSMNPELAVFPQLAFVENYAWCFPKGSEHLDEFNNAFAELKANGRIDELDKYWIESGDPEKTLEPQKSSGENGTITIGGCADSEPIVYMNGEGQLLGRDIAICNEICDMLGYKAEYVNVSWDSIAESITSGRIDLMCGTISVTDERSSVMDFSNTTYSGGAAFIVRKDRIADEAYSNANAIVTNDENLEEKLDGSSIGVMQGSVAIKTINEKYPNAAVSEFDSVGDAVEALKAKKLDYVVTAYSTAKNYERYNSSELYVPGFTISDEQSAIAVKKGNSELLEKINSRVDEYLADGTMDKIIENWVGNGDKDAAYDTSTIPYDPDTPVLNIGIAANREPMCFVSNGKYRGMDCELIERIAYDMGMHVEYSDMQFKSLIPALQSGKVDVVISNVAMTPERAEIVDFSTPYFDNPQVVMMRRSGNDGVAVSDTSVEKQSFFEKFKASFTRTFITENRWKLVLNGLGVTLIISISAFILGSLWGCVVCAGLRSKKKLANIPARVYVRLLQGTPIVVLLMILYYIVFKSFDISAIIVAIIGFALNLGAYTSEIFRTAIDSVDKGQVEAASAIGFSKIKVFSKIVFPQAARNALPVYKGEFISLVKSTSIVGYIAIQDLTKASDIIRSRTYEAFFPLIATAVIYFLVTYIFILILNAIEKKIDPKRRKRTLKGVELQ